MTKPLDQVKSELAEKHGYCDKSGATSMLFEHFELGFDSCLNHLASVGVSGAQEFWICPEEFDTETGTWLGCDVRTQKPDDKLLPFNHVIELLPVAAQLSKQAEEIERLKAELRAVKAEKTLLEVEIKNELVHCSYKKQLTEAEKVITEIKQLARQYFKDKGEVK